MPGHIVLGSDPFAPFEVGSSPTVVPISAVEIPFNIVVAGNQFSFLSAEDYIIDMALNVTGVDSSRTVVVELFDATAGAVVVTNGDPQSFSAKTAPFTELSDEFIFAVLPIVGHQYEIHITIPGAPGKTNLATVQLVRWAIESPATGGGGGTVGPGTINRVAKFTAPNAVGDSNIMDDGISVTVFSSGAADPVQIVKAAAAQTADLQQWQDSAGTVLTRVDANGQIGIGTVPISPLNVVTAQAALAAGQEVMRLGANYNGAVPGSGAKIDFTDATNALLFAAIRGYTFAPANTGLAFDTGFLGPTTKMVIDNAGNVGIGTTTPAFLLDVQGDAQITGKLTVGGAIDPTSLSLAGTAANTFFNATNGNTVPVSAANEGRLIYNSTTQTFQVSLNGAAFVDLSTGSGSSTLQQAYNAGQTIAEAAVGGTITQTPITVTNAVGTATDVLQLTKNPGAAFAGNALTVSMGANATGTGISVAMNAASTGIPFEVDPASGGFIRIGTQDSFARTQIWNTGASSVLRLGSDTADGDPSNIDSEGIVVYHPSDNTLGRMKADRFGLTRATDANLYYFRVDGTQAFYTSNPAAGPVYGAGTVHWYVNRTSGLVAINNATAGFPVQVGAELLRVQGDTLMDATSTTALQVTQAGGGTPALVVDTTNTRVGIGAAPGAFALDVTGDCHISGKLTVAGAIDPTSLSLAGTAANTFFNITNGNTVPVSAANEGRIIYNSTTQTFQASQNGGAFTNFQVGTPTLAQVLAAGNTTGANNILITVGQQIDTAAAGVLNLGNTNATATGIGNPSGGLSTFQMFVNQGGAALHGSNAGFQFSSTTANRGSARFNQYGNNAGVPGITGFKSRGANVGSLASVADGDVLARMTAIGVAADNASIPLAGFVSIQVPTGGTNATWVATDFSVSLVPLAGPINSNRQVFKITSEAAADFIDGTTAPVTAAGHGGLRYNNTTKTFQVSVDTGAWTSLSTGTTTATAPIFATAGNITLGASGSNAVAPTTADANASVIWSPFAAGKKALVLQGQAAQTANLQEWQDSTGAVMAFIDVAGNMTMQGKLTVVGAIDPSSLSLAGTAANTFLNVTNGNTVPVSAANEGRIRYNSTTQTFQVSLNGAAFTDIATGSVSFAAITSGTNTTATMIVGVGALMENSPGAVFGKSTAGTNNIVVGDATTGLALAGGADANTIVGPGAGTAITTGSNNSLVGNAAGAGITTEANNVAVGDSALNAGNFNVAVGVAALNAVTGDDNVAVGRGAGVAVTTGTQNVIIGSLAAQNMTDDTQTVIIGYQAGQSGVLSGGTGNILIGYQAGKTTVFGGNTFIGWQAGLVNTNGTNNTVVGYSSFSANTTGQGNVVFGPFSLTSNTTGNQNIALGISCLSSNTTGIQNIAIGGLALSSATTANNNIVIGVTAGAALTTGALNTVLGFNALRNATTDDQVVMVGYRAGEAQVAGPGSHSTFVGFEAGVANTTGINNTFVGWHAGTACTVGGTNTLIGSQAGEAITTGSSNTAVGWGALSGVTTGQNTAVGYLALSSVTTATGNVAVGDNAGVGVTSDGNTLVGSSAGTGLTTGNHTVCVGFGSGAGLATASDNTLVGWQAGNALAAATDTDNTFIGSEAGLVANGGNGQNVALGSFAAGQMTTGSQNTVLGYSGAENLLTGNRNTIVGAIASPNFDSSNNVAVGFQAMSGTPGNGNVFVGMNSAIGAAAGTNAVGIGLSVIAPDSSVVIGANAGHAGSPVGLVAIGIQSASSLTTGANNTFVGAFSGQNATTGSRNTGIGSTALFNLTTGSNNTTLGERAGLAMTTASDNVCIGEIAGGNLTTAGQSVVIGSGALQTSSLDDKVVMIGFEAGKLAAAGASSGNHFIGYQAGAALTTGILNTIFGYQAGLSMTADNDNVLIGYFAGNLLNGAGGNTVVGTNAMNTATTADSCVAIGDSALSGLTTGSRNVAIGLTSCPVLTTGTDNVAVGFQSGQALTTGSNNVIVGSNAGNFAFAATAASCVMVGLSANAGGTGAVAIGANSSAKFDLSISIGDDAGSSTATVSAIAIGASAGLNMTTGVNNIFIGGAAGNQVTTGQDNTFTGVQSGQSVTTGSGNTAYGSGAYATGAASTAVHNTAIGYQTLKNVTTGDNNVAVGYQAGSTVTIGTDNTLIGFNAGTNAGDSRGVAVGSNAFSGGGSISIGNNSGLGGMTGLNISIGFQAGHSLTTGSNNTLIGADSGNALTTGIRNVFCGDFSGLAATTQSNSIVIGYQALSTATADDDMVAIGYQAGKNQNVGGISFNTFVGYHSGLANTTGTNHTLIGFNSGLSLTTGMQCTVLGSDAMIAATTGADNIAIGYVAADALTTASGNTVVGSQAGRTITTGDSNTILGRGADVNAGANTLAIILGRGAVGASSSIIIAANTTSAVTNDLIIASGDTGISRGAAGLLRVTQGTAALATDGTIQAAGQIQSGYITTAVNYVVTLFDYLVYASAAGGAITVTIPLAAANKGRIINVKKSDATANAVTITNSGADTIDGTANLAITTQYVSYMLVSDGVSNWSII